MKPIFLKDYNTKYHISRHSWKYYLACFIELIGIIIISIGLYEIQKLGLINPSGLLIQIGGLFFVCGSFFYTKCIKH